jgi:hypothetical protein
VALRCYACGESFSVEEVAFDRVSGLSLVLPCPFCAARPIIARHGGGEASRLHQIVELAGVWERRAAAVRLELRLQPAWYETLAARAGRGSEAEACLKSSAWARTDGEYVLECDGPALVALAALAHAARCPEAIRAMREAYREAIGAG